MTTPNAEAPERRTYTVAEVAAMLGVSDAQVYDMCRDRQIPHVRIGRRRLIPVHAFDAWFERQTQGGEMPDERVVSMRRKA